MKEVRYHFLRPKEIVAAREKTSILYIPIGTIEWHGVHNATGADTLQAEGLAIRCAELGGGLVFPPLYYGENRLEQLMEATANDRDLIAKEMSLDPDNFTAARFPFAPLEQSLNYHKLLIHILGEAETLGFKVAVFIAGHYPLIDHCRMAALQHNKRQRTKERGNAMLAFAAVDFPYCKEKYPYAGDHGGGWETSHMMALHPQTVDLSLLPDIGEPIVGAGNDKFPPQQSSAEIGQETIDHAAKAIIKQAKHRLEHTDMYWSHGNSLREDFYKD